jgi:hypothetical protein
MSKSLIAPYVRSDYRINATLDELPDLYYERYGISLADRVVELINTYGLGADSAIWEIECFNVNGSGAPSISSLVYILDILITAEER